MRNWIATKGFAMNIALGRFIAYHLYIKSKESLESKDVTTGNFKVRLIKPLKSKYSEYYRASDVKKRLRNSLTQNCNAQMCSRSAAPKVRRIISSHIM